MPCAYVYNNFRESQYHSFAPKLSKFKNKNVFEITVELCLIGYQPYFAWKSAASF